MIVYGAGLKKKRCPWPTGRYWAGFRGLWAVWAQKILNRAISTVVVLRSSHLLDCLFIGYQVLLKLRRSIQHQSNQAWKLVSQKSLSCVYSGDWP